MHFHLPKPLHGWREFVGEVGIIMLGVLLALGAEQLVEAITWHREVTETRQALDAELAHNLGGFEYRQSQQSCIDKRLAELTIVVERQRRGLTTGLKHDVAGPLGINIHFAVWEAASGEARARMPLQIKLQYASLYDVFSNFRTLLDRERNNWGTLEDLDFSTQLSPQELQQARATIRRLQRDEALLPSLAAFVRIRADPLKVRGDPNVVAPAKTYARNRFELLCAPLI